MLKGVPLPEELKLTTDMAAVKGCGLVVVAVTLAHMADSLEKLESSLLAGPNSRM